MASPGQANGPPGVSGTNAMAIPQQSQQQQQNNSFEPLDKSSSNTLKVIELQSGEFFSIN